MNNANDIKVELTLIDGRKLLMCEIVNGVFKKYPENIPVWFPKEKPLKKKVKKESKKKLN